MGLNINAGALRHVIDWYEQPDDTDDQGELVDKVKVHETTMANVRTSSGSQNISIGALATDEIITVLTWYDPRIDNSHFIRWNDLAYEIQHIKPDELLKGMLITAKVQINYRFPLPPVVGGVAVTTESGEELTTETGEVLTVE